MFTVDFLYNTVIGRIFLNIMLNTGVLKLLEKLLRSPFSQCIASYLVKKYNINLSEYTKDHFTSYQEFFTRTKKEYTFEKADNVLISPSDGLISVFPIKESKNKKQYFRVKGIWYSLEELLKDKETAEYFNGGVCMIVRLQVDDYHHFIYPDDCFHERGHYIEGKLHSVQPAALSKEPVYRVNRRYWSILNTKNFGKMCVCEVGAVLIGGIVHVNEVAENKRGDEMGYFDIKGSSVVILLNKEVRDSLRIDEDILKSSKYGEEYPVKMGQEIGRLKKKLGGAGVI